MIMFVSLFNNHSLLQFDPNPWCDADMKFTPMNTGNYQLPDPTWQWVKKKKKKKKSHINQINIWNRSVRIG